MDHEFLKKCREWQVNNPDWQLFCDIDDADKYYISWNELSKRERMSWIGCYGEDAKEFFAEYSVRTPKVDIKVIDNDMNLHARVDWPSGNAMTVYRTRVNGVPVLAD